ncbi:MAG: molybdopterin-dependent oxidoreductase [Candidatus Brocadiia bacterium]
MDVKRASCMFCTSKGCAVKVYLQRGRVARVTVDTEAPVQPGAFCVRPTLAKDYQYHDFRLSYPLKRAGRRGANRWETISWQQALDEIAGRIASLRDQYGAETVATSSGTGRGAAEFAKTRFMNLLGSPNRVGAITICYAPRAMVWFVTFGGHLVPDPDTGKTKMMVLWGRNPHEGGPSSWHRFQKARDAGLKTLVVDPRCTEPARQADCWAQLRPGTDAALALGLIHVVIREQLYNKEFVESATRGFGRLRARAREYPPERVAAITAMPPDTVRHVARFYAAHQPSQMVIGVAPEHGAPNSIQAVRAINCLRAICGSVDVAGGDLITGPHPRFVPDVCLEANERLAPEQRAKQLGSDRFRFLGYPGWELIEAQMRRKWGERHAAAVNLHSCAHAPTAFRAMLSGKPYPVRALLVAGSNPLLSYANSTLVYRALMSLDLLVTSDITWTPTTLISDYVLPAACWMERPDMGNFAAVGGYPLVQMGQAALPAIVPGEHERLDDYQLWRQLGLRLGQEDDWPWETFEELWEYRLQELMAEAGTATLDEFVARKRHDVCPPRPGLAAEGLATPSGKVELYSAILAKLRYDPLPHYRKPEVPEEVASRYPLVNISGVRAMPYHHSEYRHVDAFRRRHPDPIVEIHVDVARRKDIHDGDWVWIESPTGRCRQRARLSTAFDPRYVVTQHAWWFPEMPPEAPSLHGVWVANINVTTDDDPDLCDPLSGGWPLKGLLLRCRIYKAAPDDMEPQPPPAP